MTTKTPEGEQETREARASKPDEDVAWEAAEEVEPEDPTRIQVLARVSLPSLSDLVPPGEETQPAKAAKPSPRAPQREKAPKAPGDGAKKDELVSLREQLAAARKELADAKNDATLFKLRNQENSDRVFAGERSMGELNQVGSAITARHESEVGAADG